ncbi:MAG: hypothetical protein KBF73_08350 [Flavobacteriales bacterium]|nr:hypothetical protein [Flavobacteriales bacterium]
MAKATSKKGVVKKMREIRDAFSQEIMDMTLEEEKAYIKKILTELKLKNTTHNTAKAN